MPADRRGGARWLGVSGRDGGGQRFVLVASDEHPDSARVELPAGAATGERTVAEAELDADGVTRLLRVLPAFAPKAPPVWFAELRENSASPPAVNLLAFVGAGQMPHTVVDGADLSNLAVTSADQLGAVRWYPATGEVDQVYVRPDRRRHSVGTVLVLAASTQAMARGWPRLWGDGQRTELGEAWRNASVWRNRTDDLTHVAPAMTPDEE